MSTDIAIRRKLNDTIHEYDTKLAALEKELAEFQEAGQKLQTATSIGGTYSRVKIDTGSVWLSTAKQSLLKSAWYNLYEYLRIDTIASSKDKKMFEQSMANPPEFTIDNIRASFGDYIMNPYENIIRGLAEVFCTLDDAYKSHDRVKIGVQGLPKRIILTGLSSYSMYGQERLKDVLNALAAYQRKPLITWPEINLLLENEDALLENKTVKAKYGDIVVVNRGVRLKRFKNGNGHLYFEPDELRDINLALADYYGEVLADCYEAKAEKKQASTAVSKDLQYYPTPLKVVDRIVNDLYRLDGELVLEPSCGCGRFMDALKAKGAKVIGVEVDLGRAEICMAKGHKVLVQNFLETEPKPIYDRVVMNPPFYGKHYAKHVEHALKFLKPDGVLTAILPATARYDHGLVDGNWCDLPVGSFRESGTNINTTVLTIRKKSNY